MSSSSLPLSLLLLSPSQLSCRRGGLGGAVLTEGVVAAAGVATTADAGSQCKGLLIKTEEEESFP